MGSRSFAVASSDNVSNDRIEHRLATVGIGVCIDRAVGFLGGFESRHFFPFSNPFSLQLCPCNCASGMLNFTLSVVVPLVHPSVYVERCLLRLEQSLEERHIGTAEALVAPVDGYAHTLPTFSGHSEALEVRVIPAVTPRPSAWIAPQPNSRSPCCADGVLECACTNPEASPATFAAMFARLSERAVEGQPLVPFVAALNRAARQARSELLLLLSELAEPQPGFLPPLERALREERAGLAGGHIADSSGRIEHAGITVSIGPLPADSTRGTGIGGGRWTRYGGWAGAALGGTSEADSAVPVMRWQGLLSGGEARRGERVGEGEIVRAVGFGSTLVHAGLWARLGGLNESLPPGTSRLRVPHPDCRAGARTAQRAGARRADA